VLDVFRTYKCCYMVGISYESRNGGRDTKYGLWEKNGTKKQKLV
jgi:hypothetical protein